MKLSRTIMLFAVALCVGLLVVHWGEAQSGRLSSNVETKAGNDAALRQMQSFIGYLQDSKQTNALRRFNDYVNASDATRNIADLGLTLAVLQRLRDGHTNVAIELLEGRLDSDVIGFVASYREMSESLRGGFSLKPLQYAREYRGKFPFTHRYPNINEGVTDAFKVLDDRTK